MLPALSLERIIGGLRDGHWSAREVVDDVLARAGANARLNAFVSVFDDYARQEADKHARTDSRPLAGVPISVKDDLFTAGLRTTGGSELLREFVPDADCPAVARLRNAGAIVFGKTNLSDFAMSLAPGSTLAGPCRNPWDPRRTAGASSSGAASAVAAGIGPVAIATDSGGSIRYPAALCGAVGFAPSNGRVPRHGSFGANHFFCSIGVIARDVRDVARVLSVMSGPDPADPETWHLPYGMRGTVDRPASPQRVGVLRPVLPSDDAGRKIAALFDASLQRLEARLRWSVQDVELAGLGEAAAAFRVMSDCDRLALMTRSGTLARIDESKLPALLQGRFDQARAFTGAQYAEALAMRHAFRSNLDDQFSSLNLLVGLTCCAVAPMLGDGDAPAPDLAWTNLAGCPAASIPLGLVDGMPVGLHVVARPGHDAALLGACLSLQDELAPQGFSAAPCARAQQSP